MEFPDKDAMLQADFALKKGERISDRLTEECLRQIMVMLEGKALSIDGKLCRIKQLGEIGKNDRGEIRLIFDVKKPCKELSHIEFKLVKSGFEMDLTDGSPFGQACGEQQL